MRPGPAVAGVSRRTGLQALLGLCGALSFMQQAQAGAQVEEPLADAVRTVELVDVFLAGWGD